MVDLVFLLALMSAISGSDAQCDLIETTVTGNSMQGILFDGQKITVHTKGCGTPQRYDHMLFTHAETSHAVVKQIWGMPGDTIRVGERGKFYINDVLVKTPFGKTYILLGSAKKRMKALEGNPLEGYIVLGHPNSSDSTRFGQIPEGDILGFVKREQPYIAKDNPK